MSICQFSIFRFRQYSEILYAVFGIQKLIVMVSAVFLRQQILIFFFFELCTFLHENFRIQDIDGLYQFFVFSEISLYSF